MSNQPPPAPPVSAVCPCPTIIQGRPGTATLISLPSTIAPPDHIRLCGKWKQRIVNQNCVPINAINSYYKMSIRDPGKEILNKGPGTMTKETGKKETATRNKEPINWNWGPEAGNRKRKLVTVYQKSGTRNRGPKPGTGTGNQKLTKCSSNGNLAGCQRC